MRSTALIKALLDAGASIEGIALPTGYAEADGLLRRRAADFFAAVTAAETSLRSTSRSTSLSRLMCRQPAGHLVLPELFQQRLGRLARAHVQRQVRLARRERHHRPLSCASAGVGDRLRAEADDARAVHRALGAGGLGHEFDQRRAVLAPPSSASPLMKSPDLLIRPLRLRFSHRALLQEIDQQPADRSPAAPAAPSARRRRPDACRSSSCTRSVCMRSSAPGF